jgi:hypothetical protein
MSFKGPWVALFFNNDPNKLIVACSNVISVVELSTQSTQSFSNTPQEAWYRPHALALSNDDSLLVVGNWSYPFSVCWYDTASRSRLWICDTAYSVVAVCMFGAHVLVSVSKNPTLVLDLNTGDIIATLPKADGDVFGLGVIEGLCFLLSCS